MNVISLCSGVGLIDLGLEWAGMRTVQLCEINEYATRVLHLRYPGVPVHPDVWTIEPEECDVIAAGFPCQPFSLAGKGLAANDPRHLWPAIIRSIRMARPRYVILENVPGLINRGLGDVLGDLADAGYDAEWTVFSAADVGAPHLRRRVWIVATSDADRVRVWDECGGVFQQGWGSSAIAWAHGGARPMADAYGERCTEGIQRTAGQRARQGDSERRSPVAQDSGTGWWPAEPDVGRVAHRVPARVDRLAALGNGVVPQCAELVGLRVRQLAAS